VRALVVILVGMTAACAAPRHTPHVAPVAPEAPAAAGEEAVGSGGGALANEPEVVHERNRFRLAFAAAVDRYPKGARCGGPDMPETVLGKPDQKNEMQVAHDHVVTYGFRFPEGTLMIRCRGEHVEVRRTLK